MAEAVEFRCVAGKPREELMTVGQSVTVRGPPVRMGGGTGK